MREARQGPGLSLQPKQMATGAISKTLIAAVAIKFRAYAWALGFGYRFRERFSKVSEVVSPNRR